MFLDFRPLLCTLVIGALQMFFDDDDDDNFARIASAVTPSEKTLINTNRKYTTHFPWAQDEHRTLSLSPKGGSKTQSVQNWNNNLR